MMSDMTSRERLRTTLRRQEPDRVPRLEICHWPETLLRWRREGLPADQTPNAFFGFDGLCMAYLDGSLQLPPQTLEDGPDYTLARDRDGIVRQAWKSNYAPPADVDHLLKTRDDWAAHRHRLAPTPDRIPAGLAETIGAAHARGQFVTLSPPEPVWWVLRALGMEEALMAYLDEPALMGDLLQALADYKVALIERFHAAARLDLDHYRRECRRNGR